MNPANDINDLLFCDTQSSGILSIGESTIRTGAINIATTLTHQNNQQITIGSTGASNQTITVNRPITISGTGGLSCNGTLISRGLNINTTTTNNVITLDNTGINLNERGIILNNGVITITFPNVPLYRVTLKPGELDVYRVNPPTMTDNINFCDVQTSGILSIGETPSRTGAINIATLLDHQNNQKITIGSTGASNQTITVNRPITIGYLSNPTSNMQIGGSIFSTASNVSITSAVTTNITTLVASSGVFMVSYCLRHTIASSTVAFTNTNVVISNANNNMTPLNGIQTIENANISRSTGTDVYMTTGSGVLFLTSVSNISLNVNYTFTGGTISISGDLRLVRIG
jgi:hypothetical protein